MPKRKSAWPWLGLSLFIIVLDQLSKYFASYYLSYGESFKVWPFFNLWLKYNQGAAWGFLSTAGGWQIFLLAAISSVVVIGLVVWLFRTPRSHVCLSLALSCILGGALGNLIDRVRLNYVIDFFDFHLGSWHFATFNVADAAISVGAVLLVIQLLFFKKL